MPIIQEIQNKEAQGKMSSKSITIKSKKQKLLELKQERMPNKTPVEPRSRVEVIVESDSDQPPVIQSYHGRVGLPGQNDRELGSNAGKDAGREVGREVDREVEGRAQGSRFNNFNLDRLRAVTDPFRKENKPAILGVVECLQGIDETLTIDSRPILYKKAGVSAKKSVSENYLKARLQHIDQQKRSSKQEIPQNNPEAPQAIEQQKQKPIKRIPRYFDDQLSSSNSQQSDSSAQKKKSVKCYRCGQKGHIARLCNQRQTLKCLYCLGSHHHSQCTDKLCHRCNEKGHIKQVAHIFIQQCKSQKIQCRRCRNYGHVAKNCGKIMMMNFSVDREREIVERYAKEDLQKMKCFKCNGVKDAKGHFNCHQYCAKVPKVYDKPYIVLN